MPTIQTITNPSGTFPYVPNTRTLTINGVSYDLTADRSWTISTSGTGTVTSVALSATMPTGLVASISGSPITSNGTLGLTVTMQSGYAIPTTAKQTQWDSAYSFTSSFPTGSAQQLLRVNTLGTALEFFTPSFLTSASIIATTPLVWNSGTNTMSIPQANNTTNGFLASTDWLTFSSKQNAITLTTTGNNGSATLIGATLNIPTYTLTGLGGMSNPFTGVLGQMIYSNSAGAPLVVAPNTTTTKKYLSMTGDGTNGDQPFWDTISGFIGGSGTTNYIPKFTASGTIGNSVIYENSGNIGINAINPAQKLEVRGDGVKLRLSTQTDPSLYYLDIESNYNAGNTINFYGANGVKFLNWNYNTQNLILNPTIGNVGIGTTPSYKLDVNGDSATRGTKYIFQSVGNNTGYIYFDHAGTQVWKQGIFNDNTSTFSIGNGAGFSRLFNITNAGNVGIGTQSPSNPLQVEKDAGGNAIAFFNSLNSDGYGVAIRTADNGSDKYVLRLDSNAGSTPVMYATNAANVGIGTTAPLYKLDVNGNVGVTGDIFLPTGYNIYLGSSRIVDVSGGLQLRTNGNPMTFTGSDGGLRDFFFNGTITGGSWQGNAVFPAYGGTGATSLTGVVIGNGTSSMTAKVGTSNQLLRRNVADTDYEFFTHNFITNPMTSLGDMIYGNAVGLPLRLPANTTTTKRFLAQQGDGTNGDVPFWDTISVTTLGAVPTTRTITINGTTFDLSANRTYSVGTVTSVALSVPTGLSISGSPITSSGTLAISLQSGYSIPTTAKQSEWDSAYTNRITTLTTTGNSGSASLISNTLNIPTYTLAGLGGMSNPFSAALGQIIYSNASGAPLSLAGNTTTTKKFLSQTGDGTNSDAPFWDTITASSIGALSSVAIAVPTGFSVSGSPLTSNGTITIGFASGYALPTTAKQTEWDSAYTNRITSLTTTGNSGAATLISNTLNIPNYTLAGLGGLSNPMTGANGAGDMIYGNAAGAPLRLAPNTTTTKKYLSMTGDGTNGDAPFWDTITGFTGTGTTNYVTKFTSSSAIGNSLLYDNAVSVSIGNTSPQKLLHLSAANGATVMRMENTDTTVSIGETIGAIEFYGNDTASGVGGIIDAYGGGLSGEVNIDVWAGTNGSLVGGVTVKYTGAVNFTPLNAAPTPAAAGDVYYDSSTNKLRCYDGTTWNDLF